MAATLACAAEERRSMLFVAVPRMAGKSTLMRAALAHIPERTAVHHLRRSAGPGLGIPGAEADGYLAMSEIAPTGFDDYLWGDEVRTVFAALRPGLSLVTALHAPGIDEAFDVITRGCGVPAEQAGTIELVTYIRSLGPWQSPTRRVVERMHEVDGVSDGGVAHRLLYSWDEAADQFVTGVVPERIGREGGRIDTWTRHFEDAANG
jgi:hypothetical protein